MQVNAEETADGHVFLAETLVRSGRHEDAVRSFKRAAALYSDGSSDKVAAWAHVGKLQAELGRTQLSLDAYRKVGPSRSRPSYRPRGVHASCQPPYFFVFKNVLPRRPHPKEFAISY